VYDGESVRAREGVEDEARAAEVEQKERRERSPTHPAEEAAGGESVRDVGEREEDGVGGPAMAKAKTSAHTVRKK
jgi:hypothetical protein